MDIGSQSLREVRCHNHAGREAAARCPQCSRFFCRECITEHKGKMLCKECLSLMERKKDTAAQWKRVMARSLMLTFFFFGFLISWAFFFWTGRLLAAIPHKFHGSGFLESLAGEF
ncbi:MAG: hypothetical protein JW808_10565 [Victivallales bacterium]|nr:hypothetical protein [Victivallales bacterium]